MSDISLLSHSVFYSGISWPPKWFIFTNLHILWLLLVLQRTMSFDTYIVSHGHVVVLLLFWYAMSYDKWCYHVLICVFSICMASLMRYLFKYFAHHLFFVLYFEFWGFFKYFEYKSEMFLQIFYTSVACHIIILTVSLPNRKFNFNKV